MNILLTNDDGIDGKGLLVLAEALSSEHTVYIVAPDTQMSSSSQSLRYIHQEMVLSEVHIAGAEKAYKLNGTPADCVYIGTQVVYKNKIDLVISGINKGQNIANDIYYSGTVGAAKEAILNDIPAIAVSLASNHAEDFTFAADSICKLIPQYMQSLEDNICLWNVNVPNLPKTEIKGIKHCPISRSYAYHMEFECKNTAKGQESIILKSGHISFEPKEDSDAAYIQQGYITISKIYK